jgi:hypothetical protein
MSIPKTSVPVSRRAAEAPGGDMTNRKCDRPADECRDRLLCGPDHPQLAPQRLDDPLAAQGLGMLFTGLGLRTAVEKV